MAVIAAGANLGTVIAFPLSSVMAHYVNWESVFYLSGGVSLLWFAFWSTLVFNSPEDHPSIQSAERDYILKHIVQTSSSFPGGKLPSPPIRDMLTSMPFWALLGTHVAQMWGYYTLLALIPTYLQNIQHFSLKSVRYKKIIFKFVVDIRFTFHHVSEWFHLRVALLLCPGSQLPLQLDSRQADNFKPFVSWLDKKVDAGYWSDHPSHRFDRSLLCWL